MKKTQRVLSFLLTAAMLLGLLSGLSVAFAAAATSTGSCGTSVNYLYSQGKLFIYGSGRMADYNLGGAPWSSYATQIKQVEISSNVQNIGAAAFANLTECTSYSIPQSVTEIGQYAFVFNTSLTTISLPGVLAVGSNAFVGCEKLSDASYPAKATIAQGNEDLIRAAGASASSSPSIPPESMLLTGGTDRGIQWKIYAQGTLVISPEQSGQSVYIPDYTTSGRRPWEAYKAHIEALIITDNILSIGDFAFADMPALSSVYIGSSTTMINMYAFKDCLALQTIEFSDKMKTISGYAFYGCYSLSEVITPLTVDRLHIGIGNEQLTNAMQIGITPGGAETPGAQASGYVPGTSLRWSIASGVLTVTSMSGSEAIPNYASAAAPWAPYARQIVSIKLNGITQIGYYAFANMPGLSSVDLGTTATEILSFSFYGATSLRSLTLPASLRSIQAYAFSGAAPIIVTTPNPQVLMDISSLGHDITVQYSFSASQEEEGSSAVSGKCGEGVYYDYDEESGKMIITGYGEIYEYGESRYFPWFDFSMRIREIEIRQGVTSIPARAFYKTGELVRIIIPKSVETIGENAFYLSSKLKTAVIDNVESGIRIHERGNSYLTQVVTYTNNGTVLPGGSLDNQTTRGDIENTNISWYFHASSGGLTVQSSKTGGEAMPDYTNYNGSLKQGNTEGIAPWAHLAPLVKKITLHGITHIGEYAFSDMTALHEVSFADITYEIGSFAFARDKAISQLFFPISLVTVEDNAFFDCSLSTVAVTPLEKDGPIEVGKNNNITIRYGVEDTSDVREGYVPGSNIQWSYDHVSGILTLQSTLGVESIPDMVIGGAPWQRVAPNITSVRMSGIKEIGNYAFCNLSALTSVDLAPETTTIGTGAFMGTPRLHNLSFGPFLTEIESYAFEGCTITALSPLARGAISIGSNNSGLTVIYGQNTGLGTQNRLPGTSIYWMYEQGTLTLQSTVVGGEAMPDFFSATSVPWSAYRQKTYRLVLNGITHIGQYAFADMSYLKEVSYASNTREIGGFAFVNCTSLKSQTLPEALRYIDFYAFYNCTDLETVTPNAQDQMVINSLGNEGLIWTFGQNANPSLVTQSGRISGTTILWEFFASSGLLKLTSTAPGGEAIPENLLGTYPWGDAPMNVQVTKLELQGITAIGMAAFPNMPSLEEISFGDSVQSIGRLAFVRAKALRTLQLPASLTMIAYDAFASCNGITAYTPNAASQMSDTSTVQNVTFLFEQHLPEPEPEPEPDPEPELPPVLTDESGTIEGTSISWEYHAASMQLTVISGADGGEALPSFAHADQTPWAHLSRGISSIRITNITAIGDGAFTDMSALTCIVLPGTVGTIEAAAFGGCDALQTVYFAGSEDDWIKLTEHATDDLKNAAYHKAVTLTVEYYCKNNTVAAPSVVTVGIPGDTVELTSPTMAHYSTEDTVISRTLQEDETVRVVYTPDHYTLTVYYVDDQGKEIAPPTVHFLYYNENFKQTGTAILPVLEGYRTACEVIDLGLITEPGDRTFTVTYLPLTYTVSVVQVDRSGTRLSDKVYTFTVLHGSDATIDLSALDEIPHYELSDQNTYVIKNVKADITADNPHNIVYQKKAYALTIEFQNAEGNPIDQSQIITAYYGEPVRYEVPSRQEQGYMALDSVLTLESYNGQKSLVARYKRVIFQIELQLVEVSADGQRQLLSEKMDIVYGTHFVYQAPVIIGYTAAQAQIDLGTVTEQPQTPIVIAYTPDAYDLTIQLVDAQGNLLGTQLVTDIRVGSTYKILLDPVDGYVTDGITVEGIMSPEEVNKTVSVTLNKKPAPQPDPEPQPEPDPKPEPQPSDDGSDLTIVLVGVGCAIGMALGVTVTVLVLRKRKQKQQE